MSKLKAEALFEKFKQIEDPRRDHLKAHQLFAGSRSFYHAGSAQIP
jgi:hypothetical protein